jgi:hypothetical protein
MLFQMQIVPGHINDILWQFDKPGASTSLTLCDLCAS